MIADFFRLAINNLRHRKRRSWLTIIGTLIGIMAVVSLISIGQGLETSIEQEFRELGGNKIFINPGGGISSQFSDTTITLTEDDLEVIRNTQGVERASGGIQTSMLVTYKDESKFVSILGMQTGGEGELFKEANNIDIEQGRYLRGTDTTSVVVGQSMSEDVFEDQVYMRSKLRIEGREFRVVGVAEQNSNTNVENGIIMPIETAREMLDRPEQYDMMVAEVNEGFEPSEVEENIDRNLRQERDVEEGEEDFQTQTADDIIRSFQNQLSIVSAVITGIAAISLLVGGIGIMNTMYTSVAERTREIGVMKAVGATNRQIMMLFLVESGVVGLIGGLIGATLGLGISALATGIITQQLGIAISPYIGLDLVAGSLVFSFVVGAISGVLPARRAAKLKPAEAVRYG